jgi:hypothetical protein
MLADSATYLSVVVAAISALPPSILVLAGFIFTRRDANKKSEVTLTKVAEVHTLVNSQSDEQQAKIDEQGLRIESLEAKLVQIIGNKALSDQALSGQDLP